PVKNVGGTEAFVVPLAKGASIYNISKTLCGEPAAYQKVEEFNRIHQNNFNPQKLQIGQTILVPVHLTRYGLTASATASENKPAPQSGHQEFKVKSETANPERNSKG